MSSINHHDLPFEKRQLSWAAGMRDMMTSDGLQHSFFCANYEYAVVASMYEHDDSY